MIKKEIFIGLLTGLAANIIGMLLYILIFSESSVGQTIIESIERDFMGTLITAGAILNFLPFFVFLKKEQHYRARGVLMASILAALVIAILKLV
jgi:peptidoglycan/LPS O-acetylase OafA/YrhL